MKQSEYLRELRSNLERGLPQDMVDDIIADYETFFISGREEGKCDDEISEQLGSPAFLAQSLLEEYGNETYPSESRVSESYHRRIANPGRRLCAFLIDGVIAVLPGLIAAIPMGSAYIFFYLFVLYSAPLFGLLFAFNIPVANTFIDQPFEQWTMIAVRISLLFYMLYSLVTTLLFSGQTIGKKLMGIRVQSYNKQTVGKATLINREFVGKVIMNSIPFVAVASLLTMLITKEHKALHDMLADTVVSED